MSEKNVEAFSDNFKTSFEWVKLNFYLSMLLETTKDAFKLKQSCEWYNQKQIFQKRFLLLASEYFAA